MSSGHDQPAAQGHYAAAWFDWCELCCKWRIRIFWWVEVDGTIGDTVCWRCRR